ncbi:MAG: beta strand repeat-containing protein, partial [bacterium]
MSKYSNKKALISTIVALLMVLSAFLVISSNSAAASGSFTTDPTVFAVNAPTVTYLHGGTFGSGSTILFFLSTTTTYSSSDPQIGTTTLPANKDTLDQPAVLTIPAGTTPGTYYILAEDIISGAPSGTFAYSNPITVSSLTPSISLTPTTQSAGGKILLSGSGWDPSATLEVYLNYTGSTVLLPSVSLSPSGTIPAKTYFSVPTNLPSGTYYVVAQESSSNSPNYGITADAQFTLTPAIGTGSSGTPTPGAVTSISGSTSSSFVIAGYGFPAGATIAPSSSGAIVTVAGVTALQPGTTVTSSGSFTLTVTGLVSPITTSGPQTISITTSKGTFTFTDAIYVSVPSVSTTLVVTDLVTGTNSGYGTDQMQIIGYGFPSGSSVTVYFEGNTYTTTADSNGFFIIEDPVPLIPAGTYNVFAVAGGVTASTTFTVESAVMVLDSASNNLNGEYAAKGSAVTVYAQGLAPYQMVDVLDSGFGDLAAIYYYHPSLVTITAGSYNPYVPAFVASGTGTLTLTYTIHKSLRTGTPKTITVESLPSGSTLATATYYTIGHATTSLASSYTPSATVSLTFSGLVPYGAPATPQSAGYLGPYSIYVGSTLITLTNGKTTFISSTSGTATVSFVLPITTTGVNTITVYGASTSTGKTSSSKIVYVNYELIVSTPGTTGATVSVNTELSSYISGSGISTSPFLMYPDPNGYVYGLEFDLYDFPANSVVTVTYYTSSGKNTAMVSTDANGAGTFFFAPPNSVGGIGYSISFYVKSLSITGSSYYYELEPAVAFDQSPFLDNSGTPVTDYFSEFGTNAISGTNVTVYANSLMPQTAYNVSLAATSQGGYIETLGTFVTDANGNGQFTFAVPSALVSGTYYLLVNPADVGFSSPTPYSLTLEVTQSVYAFPGMLVQFSWTPTTAPMQPGIYSTVTVPSGQTYTISYGPIYVTVYLNGTAYTTFPAAFSAGTISGSYLAPNAVPGTSWNVNYSWSQNEYIAEYTGGTPYAGSTISNSYSMPSGLYGVLTLVSGNGALLTGISSSQIATVVAAVNNAVSTSMQVPLSELNASVVAINN